MQERSGVVTVLIPLPLLYNADRRGRRKPIEDSKFEATARDIAERFQAGGMLHRFRTDPPEGFWWDKGYVDRDVLVLLEADLPDTAEARAWLGWYAHQVLLRRFRQKAMYMKFIRPIETIEVTHETVTHKSTASRAKVTRLAKRVRRGRGGE